MKLKLPNLKKSKDKGSKKTNSEKDLSLRPESKIAKSINKISEKGRVVGSKESVTVGPKSGKLAKRVNPFAPIAWLYRYIKGSIKELRKVTWPDRKKTWKITGTVFLFSIVMAAFLFGVDSAFSKLFEKLFL